MIKLFNPRDNKLFIPKGETITIKMSYFFRKKRFKTTCRLRKNKIKYKVVSTLKCI